MCRLRRFSRHKAEVVASAVVRVETMGDHVSPVVLCRETHFWRQLSSEASEVVSYLTVARCRDMSGGATDATGAAIVVESAWLGDEATFARRGRGRLCRRGFADREENLI